MSIAAGSTRRPPLSHAVCSALLAATILGSSTPLEAQGEGGSFEAPALLQRLERGDWVWSLDFPRTDALLLGYGIGLVAAVREKCTSFPISAEERWFGGSWIMAGLQREGRVGPNLAAVVFSTAQATAASAAGTDDGRRLAAQGCNAAQTRRATENAMKMTAGQRPAHGGPTSGITLVEEKHSPVNGRHFTERSMDIMDFTPLAQQFVSHAEEMAGRGFQVLECHYDSDPADSFYEVQYYWGGGLELFAQLAGFLPELVRVAQQKLEERARASGLALRATPRHPFLDYAHPRSECPARRDAALPIKQIAALRKADGGARLTGKPVEPVITEPGGTFVSIAYGPVPDDFVPPLSLDTLPHRTLMIRMEKSSPFVLSGIERGNYNHVHNMPLRGRTYFIQDGLMQVVNDDENAVIAEGGKVLKCWYNTERKSSMGYFYLFWYKVRPPSADRARLRSRVTDHPFLDIRAPQPACPQDANAARAIGYDGGETRAVALPPRPPVAPRPPRIESHPTQLSIHYGSQPNDFVPAVPLDTALDRTLYLNWLAARDRLSGIWRTGRDAFRFGYSRLDDEAGAQMVKDNARLLRCDYNLPADVLHFWYKERPPSAEPERLQLLPPQHPFHKVGPPRRDCPLTLEAGRAAMK